MFWRKTCAAARKRCKNSLSSLAPHKTFNLLRKLAQKKFWASAVIAAMSYSICYSSLRYKRMKKRLQKVIMVPRLVTRWSKVFLSTIAPLLKIERRRSKLACLVYLCILRFWNELLSTQSRNQTTLLVTRVHHHFLKSLIIILLYFSKSVSLLHWF